MTSDLRLVLDYNLDKLISITLSQHTITEQGANTVNTAY